MILYAAAFVFAYLLGSIPFGLILTRMAGLGDIRAIGSGNIGATNVLRTGNKKVAAATLLLDALKGAVAMLAAQHLSTALGPVAALGAMLGHIFPVWLKFKGGKGVATGLGVLLALCWPAGIAVCLVWALTAARLRISSLAALVGFGISPLTMIGFGRADLVPFAVLIAALVFATHHENIHRLLNHAEPKIGSHKNTDEPHAH